jgi:hypothetical protein
MFDTSSKLDVARTASRFGMISVAPRRPVKRARTQLTKSATACFFSFFVRLQPMRRAFELRQRLRQKRQHLAQRFGQAVRWVDDEH